MAGSTKRGTKDPTPGLNESRRTDPSSEPGLDRVIQAQIGDKLRAMYGELSSEPIPDRLAAIISRLGPTTPSGSSS